MAPSIVLCNFKKIILNLKHLKVCDYICHFFPCVFTLFLELKTTTTKPQFRSHFFVFSYSFLQCFRVHEHSSWNPCGVGYSPHSNAYWWGQKQSLISSSAEHFPLTITQSLAPSHTLYSHSRSGPSIFYLMPTPPAQIPYKHSIFF